MSIKVYTYTSLPAAAIEIREEVFIAEQGFSYEFDKNDDISHHLVAYEGDRAVATLRIFKDEKSQRMILGRLAVRKDRRRSGIGREMLAEAQKLSQKLGERELYLHAQLSAKEFYEKCGFQACAEVDYDEGKPHVMMKKTL